MFGDKIAKIPKLVEKKKFEPLIAMASDKKMDVRLAAIAGLGQVDVDEAYNALVPMLRENEPEVRIAAGKASVLYRFSKECVYKVLVPQYPDIALCLLRSLARKTRLFANQSVTLSVRELPIRICRFLRLQASMLPDGSMDRRIVPELNQQELASLLGVHRVTLNKAMRDLERDGVIGPYSRHEVYVLNTQHFMELVEMEI